MYFIALSSDLSLVKQIILVSNKDSWDIIIRVFFNFIHPVVDSFVWLFICCVIHYNNAMSALVIWRCNCLKSLLTCSVPNLKLYSLSVNFKSSDFLNYQLYLQNLLQLLAWNCLWKCRPDRKLERENRTKLTANLRRREDFPTPEFPMRRILKR